MATLTLHADSAALATIEIGTGPDFDDDASEIAPTGGNLYLFVDGVEVGSLWFHRDEETGANVVTLGHLNEEVYDWVENHTLVIPATENEGE